MRYPLLYSFSSCCILIKEIVTYGFRDSSCFSVLERYVYWVDTYRAWATPALIKGDQQRLRSYLFQQFVVVRMQKPCGICQQKKLAQMALFRTRDLNIRQAFLVPSEPTKGKVTTVTKARSAWELACLKSARNDVFLWLDFIRLEAHVRDEPYYCPKRFKNVQTLGFCWQNRL